MEALKEPTAEELAEVQRMEREVLAEIDADERAAAEGWAWARERARQTEAVLMDDLGNSEKPALHVVQDLLPEGQLILLCGEEGGGKTWLVHQIAHEATRGVPVLGAFGVPRPVHSALIVDVEQTVQDIQVVNREMRHRGVYSADSNVFFLDGYGRRFDDMDDLRWLGEQVVKLRPDILIVDTVTDGVTKPMVDESVGPLMTGLGWLLKNGHVRVVVGLAHPRKTGQGRDAKGRDFDSLFGSHLWKSKASAVYWLTEQRLTVWKQRGQYLHGRWGKRAGDRYVWGSVVRQPLGAPTLATAPPDEDADNAALDAEVLDALRAVGPAGISRAELQKQLKKQRAAVLESVARQIVAGTVWEPSAHRVAAVLD